MLHSHPHCISGYFHSVQSTLLYCIMYAIGICSADKTVIQTQGGSVVLSEFDWRVLANIIKSLPYSSVVKTLSFVSVVN